MVGAQKPAQRHHVVSKFYLERFADERHMLVSVPLGGGASTPIPTRSATVQKDFYGVEREGVDPDAFEKALGDLEAPAASAMRRLIDEKAWPIADEDRYYIACWIALQHIRSVATRTAGEEIYRSIAKLEVGTSSTAQLRARLGAGPETSDEEIEALRAKMLATADTFEVDHHSHLKLILEGLEDFTNLVFFRHPWILTNWNRQALATSDTPVILGPSEGHGFYGGGGPSIGTASELLLPLGRRSLLIMGELGGDREDYRGVPTALIAKRVNQYTLMNARREAFHHPDDDPFNELELPERRNREMDTPDAQINSLIASFAAQQGRPSGLPPNSDLEP